VHSHLRLKFHRKKIGSNRLILGYAANKSNPIADKKIDDELSIENSVQTYEMLQEIITTLSALLKIKIAFNSNDNNLLTMDLKLSESDNLYEYKYFDLIEFSQETLGKNIVNFKRHSKTVEINCPYKSDSEEACRTKLKSIDWGSPIRIVLNASKCDISSIET